MCYHSFTSPTTAVAATAAAAAAAASALLLPRDSDNLTSFLLVCWCDYNHDKHHQAASSIVQTFLQSVSSSPPS
jgi:hypothetical protein